MMSILGAKAEDMEEILKGLGYRAETKPAAEVTARLEALDQSARDAAAAAEAAKAAAAAQAAEAVETEAQAAAEESQPEAAESSEAATSGPASGGDPASEAEPGDAESQQAPAAEAIAPDASEAAQPVTDETVAQDTDAPASPEPEEAAAQGGAEDASEADAPATEKVEGGVFSGEEGTTTVGTATGPLSTEESAEAEEPKPVLLWRPARFERGPRHEHQRGHGKGRHQGGAANANVRRDERDAGHRRVGQQEKPGRPDGDGKGRNRHRKGAPGEARNGNGKPAFQKPREERPVRFDPDSPFAKLAALRDQLKK